MMNHFLHFLEHLIPKTKKSYKNDLIRIIRSKKNRKFDMDCPKLNISSILTYTKVFRWSFYLLRKCCYSVLLGHTKLQVVHKLSIASGSTGKCCISIIGEKYVGSNTFTFLSNKLQSLSPLNGCAYVSLVNTHTRFHAEGHYETLHVNNFSRSIN